MMKPKFVRVPQGGNIKKNPQTAAIKSTHFKVLSLNDPCTTLHQVAWIAYKSLYFYTFIILSFFFVLVLKKTWNQPPLYFLNLNLRSGQVRLSHDILSIVTMIVCMYESVLRNKFSGFQYTLWVKEVVLLPSILQVAKIKWWKLLLDSNTSISCYTKKWPIFQSPLTIKCFENWFD